MDLLTIIVNTLQIFSLIILLVISLSYAVIKIKSKTGTKSLNIINHYERELAMSKTISNNDAQKIKFNEHSPAANNLNPSEQHKSHQTKIYAVYNPESNPHFYLYNKLNWYKNFDWLNNR